MNILVLSWRGIGHPNAGGAEIVTFEHARAWVKARHSVTVFTSYYKGARSMEEIEGVKFIRSGSEAFGVKVRAYLWYISGAHEMFDLVVDEFHGLPFFAPLYVKVKKLAFIHEVAKEVWKLNPWPKPLNLIPWIIGSVFEPLIFKLFYRNIPFMTVSNSTKEDLVEWGTSKRNITTVPNGVNISKLKGGIQKEKMTTITYLGSLSKDKGIEDAISVFNHIYNNVGNFQYWIIGKGEEGYVDRLKKRVKSLQLDKNVKFWGFVSERQKFELLFRSHILINPSIREGWGLVVIEAASTGTPTVGYNVPGLKDSIINHETGILCERNPQRMAEQVVNLLEDKKRYQKMSKQARVWGKKFTWEKSTNASLNLIEKIMSD